MFVEAQVVAGRAASAVVALPASAISYAPYGDSVFVVGELEGPDGKSYRGVRQQFVKLGGARGDQVAVVSGLEAGRGGRDLGRLQAPQRRRRAASTTRSSPRNEPPRPSRKTTEDRAIA